MSESPLDVRELYERYGRAVLRRCQYFLRNPSDAEDAMHEVFLRIVTSGHAFRSEASPLTWITRITTNHCLNVLRGKKATWRERYETTVKVDAAERPHEVSRLERREMVYAVLAQVDSKTQEAAVYYFVDEMSQDDAAAAAKCSVPTLRKRLRQFIKTARKELKRQDMELVFGPEPI